MIKKIVLCVMCVCLSVTGSAKANFEKEILVLGISLSASEEAKLRDFFGVGDELDAIYVDSEMAFLQLGLDDYEGGWYSSAYVKLTNESGIRIDSTNISLVTDEMFANALITSGVLHCDVVIAAPFSVTGESALAGILAGVEEMTGEKLLQVNKEVASEEIDTAIAVAYAILNDEENEIASLKDAATLASAIMTEVKQEVVKYALTPDEIAVIINNVTEQYDVKIDEKTYLNMIQLMENVNELNLDFVEIKEMLDTIGTTVFNELEEAGILVEESNILDQVFNFFADLVHSSFNLMESFLRK